MTEKEKPVTQHLCKHRALKLIELVSERTQLSSLVIMSRDKSTPLSLESRHCVMWLCHHGFGMGWSQIKHVFSCDHTTVINAVRRFGIIMTEQVYWRVMAHQLLELLNTEECSDDAILRRARKKLQVDVPVTKLMTKKEVLQTPLPRRQALVIRSSVKPRNQQVDTVAFYGNDGDHGTSRAFLEEQNERFAAAMRKALKKE